ncbi:methylated-DNA--[protein]-cysteine S-methyltransferase [Prevotella intermedia]|uniref:Methylated-DNA--protein-cysteine methyltransferase n=1 Tax=Prevotella intermedia TaxID=28131 RepID=A0A2G9IHU0_PREIN|nr:methylated-DNA--[protein]-cysteine S-methyltransferase [Prevotella intermedia]PIN29339.1 6-O-methylguanine DNA methyltransferase [Prevotella intermedia]
MQHIQTYESPLGELTFVSDGTALLGVWYDKQELLEQLLQSPYETCNLPVFDETRRWFDLYFDGREPDFTPPLHLVGTDFRQQVWNDLLLIPYGETTTYGALAQQMAYRLGKSKMSAQAIGGAVGYNPISIIVPCHRVVGADGTLTGYAGGIWRKEYLLKLEAKNTL